MLKYFLIFFLVCTFPSDALHRDIELKDQMEYDSYFCRECIAFLYFFGKQDIWPEFGKYTHKIPVCPGKHCKRCMRLFKRKREGIYAPYLTSKDYFEMLQDHLVYVSNHHGCDCYWPEINAQAAEISDLAYELFFDLFTTTPLAIIVEDEQEQKKVLLSSTIWTNTFSARGVVIALICNAFFFSHYCKICEDFDRYSRSKFEDDDYFDIRNKIENIKKNLASLFLEQYNDCLSKHANKRVEQEKKIAMQFVESPIYENVLEALNYSPVHNLKPNPSPQGKLWSNLRDWRRANILLEQGHLLNSLLLYPDAIEILTVACQQDPTNPDIFIERAIAYFETNQLSLALQDYSTAKKLTFTPPFKINEKGRRIALDVELYEWPPMFDELFEFSVGEKSFNASMIPFTKGLIKGTLQGAKEATNDFIPSLMTCCRGLFHGLWAFACSPEEVSREIVVAAYDLGVFISSHDTAECLQCVVPELKDLALSWEKIDHFTKGYKFGYVIGKYGIDIFAPLAALKGVKAVNQIRNLKKATTMQTLELCAVSQSKQAVILEESVKRASIRQSIASTKKSLILTKSSNVQYHIMQEKHAWGKLVELSGNIEKDFKKIVAIIEDNNILDPSFLKDKPQLFPKVAPKIRKAEYEKIINNCKVHVEFETYLETGETFLKDAWVVTK